MKAYERLLDYVRYSTTSDDGASAASCPSTAGQKALGADLVKEMLALGIRDAHMDESGYVYGTLEANCPDKLPVLGFISHMDTSPSAPGSGIKPRIVHDYDGGDLSLNEEQKITMRAADFPSLKDYAGQDLIVTDGTTLLGSDDKAGIAEILTAAETVLGSGRKHGTIKLAFTPDEEIGRGPDRFDVRGFGAEYAYTVDGGALGELEYENFNAAGAEVIIHGVNTHPGEAKNKMKNSILIGMEFNAMLPPHSIPFCTEGYEGFHHLMSISGSEEKTALRYIIRDHDMAKFQAKKALFERVAAYLNEVYGSGTVELKIQDSYYNMKEKIEPFLFLVENAKTAMEKAGVTPRIVPIRGGTDGSRLSFMGLPCPNLSTGGINFHSRFEYISIQAMDRMTEVLVNLMSTERQ